MSELRVDLAGIVIDLVDEESAVAQILGQAATEPTESGSAPLSVVSANLDHIAQFGRGSRWEGTIGDSLHPTITYGPHGKDQMDWLTLLDGAPLVTKAERMTGRSWPRLAGSDLIGPILDGASHEGLSVGFLGGAASVQERLSRELAGSRPDLDVVGFWCPERSILADPSASRALAQSIRAAAPNILVVGLGKPRQELWMAQYGALTGARVLLAFGAVVDFLAGTIRRAPKWTSDNGLEWAWRLALEPARLSRRYLVDDPPSYFRIQNDCALIPSRVEPSSPPDIDSEDLPAGGPGSFVGVDDDADVAACIVTYNSEASIEALLDSLRAEANSVRLKVIVADNDSTDGTLNVLRSQPDVHVIQSGGNLGYAAGLNMAFGAAGPTRSYLVLNPDLVVRPGSTAALLRRLVVSGAGIAVPQLLDADGSVFSSLRREPTVTATLVDAVLGDKKPNRPAWLTETDHLSEAYQHPHQVDWATGAAMLVDAHLAKELGAWDEHFFLYSEETDYFKRARLAGAQVWYEPSAAMVHTGGGSGSSPRLDSLLAVNRVRYARKHGSAARSIRASLALRELLRIHRPSSRFVLRSLMDESRWDALPGPTPAAECDVGISFPAGSVIIPAHNEASVIAKTLSGLQPIAEAVEIIVVCNGCTDETASIARTFDGVQVLELEASSKTAALNAGDDAASMWPRLYLDADIEISPVVVRLLFDRLHRGDILATRPSYRSDDAGASWLVRAFVRAKKRIPDSSPSLWGAGVYALSERGRARFDTFPDITADDLYVDLQFSGDEKAVTATPPVRVRIPRNTASLLAVLRRTYRGQAEIKRSTDIVPHPSGALTTGRTAKDLLMGISGPSSLVDAVVCAALIGRARLSTRLSSAEGWERDESTRLPASASNGPQSVVRTIVSSVAAKYVPIRSRASGRS